MVADERRRRLGRNTRRGLRRPRRSVDGIRLPGTCCVKARRRFPGRATALPVFHYPGLLAPAVVALLQGRPEHNSRALQVERGGAGVVVSMAWSTRYRSARRTPAVRSFWLF